MVLRSRARAERLTARALSRLGVPCNGTGEDAEEEAFVSLLNGLNASLAQLPPHTARLLRDATSAQCDSTRRQLAREQALTALQKLLVPSADYGEDPLVHEETDDSEGGGGGEGGAGGAEDTDSPAAPPLTWEADGARLVGAVYVRPSLPPCLPCLSPVSPLQLPCMPPVAPLHLHPIFRRAASKSKHAT